MNRETLKMPLCAVSHVVRKMLRVVDPDVQFESSKFFTCFFFNDVFAGDHWLDCEHPLLLRALWKYLKEIELYRFTRFSFCTWNIRTRSFRFGYFPLALFF